MQGDTHIVIKNVSKIFNESHSITGKKTVQAGTLALKAVNLEIKEGEILVLLGPSGCGKSTLLRIIGGLEQATQGEILFYGKDISNLPPERRDAGFVFQSYALFPTMTVRENISFGLKLRKQKKGEIKSRVDKLLKMMNLEEFADRKPIQLSGGQQQRVAIARVIAIEPKVLLMDEPLTALDAKLKEYLRIELAGLFRRLGITTIYVTHDQLEAMALADRIAIMNKGLIEQIGTPQEIYTNPKTGFVAQFIGKINRLNGFVVSDNDKIYADVYGVKIPLTGIIAGLQDKTKIAVFIRPEDISMLEEDENANCILDVRVLKNIFMGDHCYITTEISKGNVNNIRQEVLLEAEDEENEISYAQAGDHLAFSIKKDKILVPGTSIKIKLDINKLILLKK